jgi:stage II sporulation protein D
MVAAPALLSACNRKIGNAAAKTQDASEDVNLDEVMEAASFRPPLPKIEPVIRVRVMRVRAAGSTLRIGQENQWLRVHRAGTPGRGTALHGPVTVTLENDAWSIVDGRGFHAAVGGELREPVEIAPADDDAAQWLTLHELSGPKAQPRQYPGLLRFLHRADEEPKDSPGAHAFDIINDVPIEAYLPGVLAGELYRHWQLHTFAAQAIAARSFAATEIAVFEGKRHFDVTNTAASQMYVGSVSDSKALEAVHMTRGMVLGYDGLLVSGYYSSCCGGIAASAKDAIGSNPVNDVEVLDGRPEPDVCGAAPVYQWKVEYPIELLTRRLAAFGKEKRIKDLSNFTRLEAIDIANRNVHGRPTHIRVIDQQSAGGVSVEMRAEDFRRAANYAGQGLNPPDKPLRSSNVRAIFKRDTVEIEGFGFGHGVGLCQHGAEILAKEGKQFHDILLWYYPGVELVPAYG